MFVCDAFLLPGLSRSAMLEVMQQCNAGNAKKCKWIGVSGKKKQKTNPKGYPEVMKCMYVAIGYTIISKVGMSKNVLWGVCFEMLTAF